VIPVPVGSQRIRQDDDCDFDGGAYSSRVCDGGDYHPAVNEAKMTSGIALTDEARVLSIQVTT
jgi:hypothetical protein